MQIIHLSDTHLGRADNLERFDRVIDDILGLGPGRGRLVIHTGDLIDAGAPDQMQLALPPLERLRARGWRVLLSPGNHDCGNALKVDPEDARRFRDCFRDFIFGDPPDEFPTATVLGDHVCIGLDSNAAELGFPDRWLAEGQLGAAQRAALDALLGRYTGKVLVVYLHHHPFQDAYRVEPEPGERGYLRHLLGINTRRFRRLKDAYSLLESLRDRVHVLLFGHQHFGLDYSVEGQRYGIPLALDGGSTTGAHPMRYRVIDTSSLTFRMRFVPR